MHLRQSLSVTIAPCHYEVVYITGQGLSGAADVLGPEVQDKGFHDVRLGHDARKQCRREAE
jgi:hypothetical protein